MRRLKWLWFAHRHLNTLWGPGSARWRGLLSRHQRCRWREKWKGIPLSSVPEPQPKTVLIHFSFKRTYYDGNCLEYGITVNNVSVLQYTDINEWCRDLKCVVKNDGEHVEQCNLAWITAFMKHYIILHMGHI